VLAFAVNLSSTTDLRQVIVQHFAIAAGIVDRLLGDRAVATDIVSIAVAFGSAAVVTVLARDDRGSAAFFRSVVVGVGTAAGGLGTFPGRQLTLATGKQIRVVRRCLTTSA